LINKLEKLNKDKIPSMIIQAIALLKRMFQDTTREEEEPNKKMKKHKD
tara:strand:+ start:873 stop:1016 length:144 start_codon:yes stop_codon:yes gene_type:complete